MYSVRERTRLSAENARGGIVTFSADAFKGSGKLTWPLPLTAVPRTLDAMQLEPQHSVFTISAYGWGLAFLPFAARVVALDADEYQAAYAHLTHALTRAVSRDQFLDALKLLLSSPKERKLFDLDDARVREQVLGIIAKHVPPAFQQLAKDILLTGRLDGYNEYHRLGGSDGVELKTDMVGERLFPHVANDAGYQSTAAKVTAGAYDVMHGVLPDDLPLLAGRKFDRIFLANAITFINRDLGSPYMWVDRFLEQLRTLLADERSFMVDLEHSKNGFYISHVNDRNARVLRQFTTEYGWRYTVFQ